MSQRDFWREESFYYFQRQFQHCDLRSLQPSTWLADLLGQKPLGLHDAAVLDVGCGSGANLHFIMQEYQCCHGVGTEPSEKTLQVLKAAYPEYQFLANDGVQLPFDSNQFDLVLLHCVMRWVDRDYYVQVIGEAMRVCQRFLLVSDYAVSTAQSSLYGHNGAYRIFKMSYTQLINASKRMRPLMRQQHWDGTDLGRMETVLYEKLPLDQGFPLTVHELPEQA